MARWTRWVIPGLALVACCARSSPAKVLDGATRPSGVAAATEAAEDSGPPDAGLDAGRDAGCWVIRRAGRFFTHPDRPIRRALAEEPIVEVRRGRGGRSLGFRVTLADGTRAYFKPAQAFNGMTWQAEVAAFHLDRELGLNRTAPSTGRRVAWDELRAAAEQDRRVGELEVVDGWLDGALIWWVPERLVGLDLPDGWERWLRVDGPLAPVPPFVRPRAWREARAAERAGTLERRVVPAAPTPDRAERPAELSDLIVFDYLTQNLDRWSRNGSNLRTVGEGGAILFLDNAAGFTLRRARTPLNDARLHAVQRFRRSTVEALRGFSMARYRARLAEDPRGPLLSDRELEHLAERRAHVLEYVDTLVAEHGEDAVYAW